MIKWKVYKRYWSQQLCYEDDEYREDCMDVLKMKSFYNNLDIYHRNALRFADHDRSINLSVPTFEEYLIMLERLEY